MSPSSIRESETLCVRPKTVFGGVFVVSVVFLFATLGRGQAARPRPRQRA